MSAVIFAGTLRGDGIAISHDGITWRPGAGAYGNGWGQVGEGIRVPAGDTVYVRYYAASRPNLTLRFAEHGTQWGSWPSLGPVLTGERGNQPENAVILKLANVGTDKSTVTWVNGSRDVWHGPTKPGRYDFALDGNALWNLPPLRITSRSPWWSYLFGATAVQAAEDDTSGVVSVPDSGGTLVLIGTAVIVLGIVSAVRRRRRRLRQRAATPHS